MRARCYRLFGVFFFLQFRDGILWLPQLLCFCFARLSGDERGEWGHDGWSVLSAIRNQLNRRQVRVVRCEACSIGVGLLPCGRRWWAVTGEELRGV